MNDFTEFWSLYPRRISKRAAQRAWDKEIKAGTDPATIIQGLRRQLPYFATKDEQFIPHASTWLNQGRFEDEVTMPTQRNPGRRTISDAAESFNARFDYSDASFGLPQIQRH